MVMRSPPSSPPVFLQALPSPWSPSQPLWPWPALLALESLALRLSVRELLAQALEPPASLPPSEAQQARSRPQAWQEEPTQRVYC